MYKRMLRSALAVVFSVAAIFGAVAAVNGDTGSADTSASTSVENKVGNDFGWDTIPAQVS